jgi:hypothetical protein
MLVLAISYGCTGFRLLLAGARRLRIHQSASAIHAFYLLAVVYFDQDEMTVFKNLSMHEVKVINE